MKQTELTLKGVWIIEPDYITDDRGFFTRIYCDEAAPWDNDIIFKQHSISFNEKKGTLRGMHFQEEPYAEEKLIRVTRGEIYDVLLDLREDSTTYLQWCSVILSADNRKSLYVPKGIAHGFQTLCDQSEVYYQISTPYNATAARGVRWNDPAFAIVWPDSTGGILSDKDRNWSDWSK